MEDSGYSFNWQRQFFVTDHVKHKNGFTLYKIISVVYPKQNPEAGTKIVVWKRYNEFKTLHRELKRRHTSLHIGEEFPSLIKSSFFDRFSLDVINGRKKFISLFLNFIGKCPSLFTADIFVKFFQDGYNISEYDGKKFDSKDISPELEDNGNIDPSLTLLYCHSMGQVLNSEGSKSSDESSDENKFVAKSKFTRSDSTRYYKLKKNFSGGGSGESSLSFMKMSNNDGERFSYIPKTNYRGAPDYWEEAIAHAEEAHQQEVLGQYEVSFAMYKTAIVCLLSGVQADMDMDRRAKVKELTSQYLQQAEWIYNNYLVFQTKPPTPKFGRVPWRSRSQLRRYKVLSILSNNLLVQDIVDDTFVVIKGVLKSSCPLDRSDVCVLPNNVPYMVKLLAMHETETTVFFVLEHARYGKLWDHLEHYFARVSMMENLDTEVTCASPREKEFGGGDSDENSVAGSVSSGCSTNDTNDRSLSRLESSAYTDTMSCESLSSHDENYFDLIEDYARAKSNKLKEIQDFNERRKQVVESIRPVKKTVSQVDLKSMEEASYEQHRSHSLTDLAAPQPRDCESECYNGGYGCGHAHHRNSLQSDRLELRSNYSDDDVDRSIGCHQRLTFSDDEKDGDGDVSSVDMDTQQLLRNAQRLIESINETLSKSETWTDDGANKDGVRNEPDSSQLVSHTTAGVPTTENRNHTFHLPVHPVAKSENVSHVRNPDAVATTTTAITSPNDTTDGTSLLNPPQNYCSRVSDLNFSAVLTPGSESIPSITEEYSITAIIQRNGITGEMVKQWAAQILIALEMLHVNGVICRDLNPNNILLADNGSIKLTYFYRFPNVDLPLNFEAKEKLYVAPEVDHTNCNVTFASDWWSFGAILYEMISLQTLHQNHPAGIYSHTVLNIPDRIHGESKSLLTELLRYDPNERLGSGICGADDIKAHPYFADLNWEDV